MIDVDANTRDRAEAVIDQALEKQRLGMQFLFSNCVRCTDSPIEALFALAARLEFEAAWAGSGFFPSESPEQHFTMEQVRQSSLERGDCTFGLWPQVLVGSVRVDFVVSFTSRDKGVPKTFFAVIECDGHDFHERTKEQAERDRSRDRSFQYDGITVLRFTGREIWRDPVKCVEEVIFSLIRVDNRDHRKSDE